MPAAPPHPLLAELDPVGADGAVRTGVTRVERVELRGSGMWAGAYLAFFLRRSAGLGDTFLCTDHVDIGWAVGTLVYQWCARRNVPADLAHLTDTLFAVQDVLLEQPLKCWFHAEMVHGKCRARPIIKEFDATSPGRYFSVNDFVHQPPGRREGTELWLRIAAVLLPRHRCPATDRVYTLTADDQAVTYRAEADGRLAPDVAPAAEGAPTPAGARPTLEEIIALANQRRAATAARTPPSA